MLGTRVAGMCEIHPFAINSIILGYKVHQLPIKCIVLVYYVLNLVYFGRIYPFFAMVGFLFHADHFPSIGGAKM